MEAKLFPKFTGAEALNLIELCLKFLRKYFQSINTAKRGKKTYCHKPITTPIPITSNKKKPPKIILNLGLFMHNQANIPRACVNKFPKAKPL